jgi:hypothetical protein
LFTWQNKQFSNKYDAVWPSLVKAIKLVYCTVKGAIIKNIQMIADMDIFMTIGNAGGLIVLKEHPTL